MAKSTTELTGEYIQEHPHIKNCLKKDLINYSSLARLISKELKIENKSSKEAILIAARRFQDKLKRELSNERKIKTLLTKSEIGIKNKIGVLILRKFIDLDYVIELQKNARKENGMMYVLEGTDNYTIITQEKYAQILHEKYEGNTIKYHNDLVIIDFKSPEEIEKVTGVISYLTSLFAENGVNILEFFSCWRDTIFVIDKKDMDKAIKFLNF
ncbi:MAG: ACT domain-containing protein [Candidatus Woesearchaeota archaeon]